jgi:nucleoside-diphosphate-sugar epimerase
MKIFLTSDTGFLGSHFLKIALDAGVEVRALSRPSSNPRIPMTKDPNWMDGELEHSKLEWFDEINVLVHLAASGVDPRGATWGKCFKTNVSDSLALWLQAIEAGVKNFLTCGTCFEYGKAAERYNFIPANAPLELTGPYHSSKAAATMAALGLLRDKNIRCCILRPFHVYGKGKSENHIWPSLRKAAFVVEDFPLTLGEQIRDFIPVEDVAARLLAQATDLSTRDPELPTHIRIANVGTGRPQSRWKFAEHWWKTWNAKGKLLFGLLLYLDNEVMRYVPEID